MRRPTAAARKFGQPGGHGFGHGVDRVGAHGVATVHVQVNHEATLRGAGHVSYFQVTRTTTDGDQHSLAAVGERKDLGPGGLDASARRGWIGDIAQLDLGESSPAGRPWQRSRRPRAPCGPRRRPAATTEGSSTAMGTR